MHEIERKFLISTLPSIPIVGRYTGERYLLQSAAGTEERITHIDKAYFYEYKQSLSGLERTRNKRQISKHEFEMLKSRAYGKLFRETLIISKRPKVVIQIYEGEFAGLMRAEIEFDSEEEATTFRPHAWMGREITGRKIARDSSLARMSRAEMLSEINT